MPFKLNPRLMALALLPPLLLSTACQHRLTPGSLARTERPTLPKLPAELVRGERLAPLAAPASGETATIDRGVLGELYERLAEAVGAVERGNVRAGGVRRLWTCVDTILRTGVVAQGCAANQ